MSDMAIYRQLSRACAGLELCSDVVLDRIGKKHFRVWAEYQPAQPFDGLSSARERGTLARAARNEPRSAVFIYTSG